ncbi:DUF2703 domain-containing protein [Niallia sp. Krafla_26]|uniref:DUF2703 domain-containing protein n=1 Tax=Niallia sp. Krafla_26 TaxID=3064703 RepID=UPI003D173C36
MSNEQNEQVRTEGSCGCGMDNFKTKEEQQEKKQLIIDFMYIDLQVCTRCKGTEQNLNDAINEVSTLLRTIGYDVVINRILIENEEQAEALHFISSPTIRLNGKDIQLTVKENNCDTCGSLTGSSVDCRVWVYEGKEYTEAPKSLIMDAILKEVYGTNQSLQEESKEPYVLPENLKRFFTEKNAPNKCCISNEGASQCC